MIHDTPLVHFYQPLPKEDFAAALPVFENIEFGLDTVGVFCNCPCCWRFVCPLNIDCWAWADPNVLPEAVPIPEPGTDVCPNAAAPVDDVLPANAGRVPNAGVDPVPKGVDAGAVAGLPKGVGFPVAFC